MISDPPSSTDAAQESEILPSARTSPWKSLGELGTTAGVVTLTVALGSDSPEALIATAR